MNHVGVDIIEIDRIERAVARWGGCFLRRLYTDAELELCRTKPPSLAVRFASKEAVMKLLGIGVRGVCWRDIETLAHPSGQPFVNLYGNAAAVAERLGVKEIAVSLSHSREYAVAFASGNSE